MINQDEFLRQIIRAFEQANIPYMISGSMGSSFHGQPRATNDADIVIDPTQKQLLAFIELLGPDCYVSKEAALQAIENRSMFNVIDTRSGGKADLITRKQRPYSQQEFARRIHANFLGIETYVLSPEDSILSKLEWSKGRQSEIQFKDAFGVLIAQKDKLDFEYLKKWAKELGIEDALNRLIKKSRKID
ncbi:MAG: nucleotidyltransferase family protein [Planctomycetales bacterium]|nr:nucleotidyltransferase family protein [Planctomycetales bacterium]